MELYPTNYNETTTITQDFNVAPNKDLSIQLKELKETLSEREEELQLWRAKHDQYVETLSFNALLEEQLCRTNEEIHDLTTRVKNFIAREQVLIKEFSIDTQLQESYTTLFTQYQEAIEKIENLEIKLEEASLKYQKLLPYVHKLVEVESKLSIALKHIESVKQEKRLMYA